MKKGFWLVLCAMCAAGLLFGAKAQADSPAHHVEEALGLRLEGKPEAVQSMDSHGGLHGDGLTYIELELDAEGCEGLIAVLEQSDGWQGLPLSEDAQAVFYGTERLVDGMLYTRPAAVPEGIYLPVAVNGFWRLIDRQEGKTELIFEESRHSRNYTASLIDLDRARLYFLELDT